MPLWRRRSRRRFKPFDRSALPEAPSPTFDEMLAEGVLVAESAGRMALKNRLIVEALRGDEPFAPERAAAAARAVLYELVQEADEVAERTGEARSEAASRDGRSAHEHDYRRADAANLRRREQVYAAVARELWLRRSDPDYLNEFAERARREAWEEVSGAIETRLEREWGEWPQIEVDETYEAERDDRVRELLGDLDRGVRAAEAERARREEENDPFRGFVG
ncbi:hypothetical protein DCE93_00385 [Agromyces badenianii]|uniref:Uncharacterized protein n=1 Tax=Agromyces badenianii TaxID=2080742 RepID=A0A2S0WSL5_9MICO|nr:hypothetical protein [Agromyces badenianii]AWB94319.1 hypothetical protein DCE93_00385 [Agromyces badenianii]PWC05680.1 hypothetical protein DCE94_05350 [Agromyces badenianii]